MALIRLCSNKSLMGLVHAGDLFNDVISKPLRIQRSYQEKQQQPQMQQQAAMMRIIVLAMSDFLFLEAFLNCLMSTIGSN
jgi:hypothetical protein